MGALHAHPATRLPGLYIPPPPKSVAVTPVKSQRKLIERFELGGYEGRASHMFVEGDVLYSCGKERPMAFRYRRSGEYQFLINGDHYSVTTTCHQSQCFRLGPQVSFSALAAAGVKLDRVRVVDTRPDTWRETPAPVPWDPARVRREHVMGAVLLESDGRYLLSSIDENEHLARRSYFLSQLPREARTVGEAFDALLPDEVRRYGEIPCAPPARRQGDWFFLPTSYETKDLPRPSYRGVQLVDRVGEPTDHYVSELRLNGRQCCRGTVRHRPRRRGSQHSMLTLEDVWHEAWQNTAVGSWNAEGRIG